MILKKGHNSHICENCNKKCIGKSPELPEMPMVKSPMASTAFDFGEKRMPISIIENESQYKPYKKKLKIRTPRDLTSDRIPKHMPSISAKRNTIGLITPAIEE